MDAGCPGAEVAFQFLHMELVAHLTRDRHLSSQEQLASLEALGYRVGQAYVEKMTRDLARFRDELEIVKFLCKDFWASLFRKQVDHLKTNHQGVFVVIDDKFALLTQMGRGKQYLNRCHLYMAFPCGVVRGALTNLGLRAVVTAEVEELPKVKFTITLAANA